MSTKRKSAAVARQRNHLISNPRVRVRTIAGLCVRFTGHEDQTRWTKMVFCHLDESFLAAIEGVAVMARPLSGCPVILCRKDARLW